MLNKFVVVVVVVEYIKLQRKVCLKTKAVKQRELHKRTPMGNGTGVRRFTYMTK